uniref:Uncharacterized protein n=1 Tax=Anguilla anguilla TaxID=7936 RepID=A0A0E9P5D7_ANGAN
MSCCEGCAGSLAARECSHCWPKEAPHLHPKMRHLKKLKITDLSLEDKQV